MNTNSLANLKQMMGVRAALGFTPIPEKPSPRVYGFSGDTTPLTKYDTARSTLYIDTAYPLPEKLQIKGVKIFWGPKSKQSNPKLTFFIAQKHGVTDPNRFTVIFNQTFLRCKIRHNNTKACTTDFFFDEPFSIPQYFGGETFFGWADIGTTGSIPFQFGRNNGIHAPVLWSVNIPHQPHPGFVFKTIDYKHKRQNNFPFGFRTYGITLLLDVPPDQFLPKTRLRASTSTASTSTASTSTATTSTIAAAKPSNAILDETRISWSTEHLTETLQCSLCLNTIVDPKNCSMTSCCGCLYCTECLLDVKNSRCPSGWCNKSPIQFLPKLPSIVVKFIACSRIRCIHDECPDSYDFPSLLEHQKVCPFEKLPCTFCRTLILRSKLEKHCIQCPQRPVVCPMCSDTVPSLFLESGGHTLLCTGVKIPCPRCKQVVAKSSLQNHMLLECSKL